MLEAIFCQILILCSRASIVGIGVNADASTRGKESCNFDVFRVHQADEVFHDDVHAVFVEVAVVAKAEEIEFQAFAFDHAPVGQVADAYFGKVGLPGDGAQTGEFGAVEAYPIIVIGVAIFESFEHFGSIVAAIFCVLAEGLQLVVFAHNLMSLANGYVGFLFLEILCQYRGKWGGKCASSLWAGFYAGGALDAVVVGLGGALCRNGRYWARINTQTAAVAEVGISDGEYLDGVLFLRRAISQHKSHESKFAEQVARWAFQSRDVDGGDGVLHLYTQFMAEVFSFSQIIASGTTFCDRSLRCGIRMFAHKSSCSNYAKATLCEKIEQLVGGISEVAVAIHHNGYGRCGVAVQHIQTLQGDGRTSVAVNGDGNYQHMLAR